jgi:hypothetical protein
MAEAARKIRYSSYDSVAYDPAFETGFGFPSEGVVVQPRVLPREHTVARPKVELRPAGQVSIFAVAGFLAVALFAVMVLMSYVKLNAISDEVVNLRSQYTQLKNEESRLLAQYELAFDLKSIEAAVTSDGRMVKPQSSQVYYMDLSGNDSVEVFEQETPTDALGNTFEVLLAKAGEYLP